MSRIVKEVQFSLHTQCKFSERYFKKLVKHLTDIDKNDSLTLIDQKKIQEHYFCDEKLYKALL